MDRMAALPGMSAKPVTIADRICETLREAIVEGALPSGAALRQDELAARFGFSRMPIRDALRQLETEGLVTIHPTKGAFVAPMDAAEIREIYAIREVLETEALRLSCPWLTGETLQEAARLLDRIDAEPNAARWGALNAAFHSLLYSQCGNRRLLDLIDAHHAAADRYVRALLSDYFARPRFKELIGHPLAVLALLNPHWPRWLRGLLLTVGVVALSSILNSFAHYHTPLLVSLERTLVALVLGFILGLLLTPLVRGLERGISAWLRRAPDHPGGSV